MHRSDGDGIGADAEKAGMAQADLAGKAHEQIEADHGERENENQRADAVVIGRREKQRQHDDHGGDQDRRQQPRIEERAQTHTRSTLTRPNRPCGMATRTTRMIKKAIASL